MEIINRKVKDLIPYDKNPRKNDEAVKYVKASIEQFGFKVPIVIDADGVIVAGHTRLKAAKELGMKEVPCIVADDLNEEQIKAFRLADNMTASKSEWDVELLNTELLDLEANFDMSDFGFEIYSPTGEVSDDDFDADAVADAITEPVTKLGDVWALGRHRLICGDSTKKETYDVLMNEKKANLCVTDPPYNVNYEGAAGKIKNDHMANDAFYQFLLDAFINIEEVLADDASIYVFHADTEGFNFRKAFSDAGFYLSGCCIWKKNSLVLGRSPYQWQHEPVLFGWKKKGKHQWYTGRKETTIWEFDKPKRNRDHPTMKPIPLLAYPILNSSMTNTIVLDPFGGSGSTLIACEQSDRICYTAELDEKFCDVIVKRWELLTGGKAELL
jgi:DNA modification methylase